ncbi:hypothetical protein BDZ90DRAFT_275722 [Jaminaea rosea]|uniref:Uncharacterized protein n=1 Tax=Jaminaea rosea TaxID=1569628 RepID=A0A316UKW1_9BASI|nr:hypothetical protein BDZ90DRAFT_275722 [Jaminaea rosea]PWN25870.1 hypothetical protein BDZ90DRAFT_275722 [Jaminaea rosea]
MTSKTTASGGAPPSYQSALSSNEILRHEGEPGKANMKADEKGGSGNGNSSSSASEAAASSSQIFAATDAGKLEPKLGGPAEEYRRRDADRWPKIDPNALTVAIYGIYIENIKLHAEPHTIKITDFNGGVLWHFLFPLCPFSEHVVFLKHFENKGTVWMVLGDQQVDNPRKVRKGAGWPWTKGAEPPMPEHYVWRRRLNAKEVVDCADGRTSIFTPKISDAERQVFSHEKKLALTDSLEFSVPGTDRTFVWLCNDIMRNTRQSRWDRLTYVLHEKADLSCTYGNTRWEEAFGLWLRPGLPKELDHALIAFALVNLMLMQHRMCQEFVQDNYRPSNGSDTYQRLLDIPALQKAALICGLAPPQ